MCLESHAENYERFTIPVSDIDPLYPYWYSTVAEFPSQWWRLSRLPVGSLLIFLKRSLVAVDQKYKSISLAFLISLIFKGNFSRCFRPKVDPVMEEVLEAFAVSVKFLALI